MGISWEQGWGGRRRSVAARALGEVEVPRAWVARSQVDGLRNEEMSSVARMFFFFLIFI